MRLTLLLFLLLCCSSSTFASPRQATAWGDADQGAFERIARDMDDAGRRVPGVPGAEIGGHQVLEMHFPVRRSRPDGEAANYDELVKEAIAARNQGDLARAESRLKLAFEIATVKSEAAMLLGLVLAYQDRFDAAHRVFDEGLMQSPHDTELLLAKARVTAFEGRFSEALATVEAVLKQSPRHLDARNLRARIMLYRGQYVAGKSYYLEILEDSPDNLEALVGLYDSDRYLGNETSAEFTLQRAEMVAPAHPDVVLRRGAGSATAGPSAEVILGYGRSTFDRAAMARWHDRFVELRHFGRGRNQQYLRLESAGRFGQSDSLVEFGATIDGQAVWPIAVSVGIGDDVNFLPKWRWQVSTSTPLPAGVLRDGSTLLVMGYTGNRYLTGSTHRLNLALEHYLDGWDAWIVPTAGIMRDEAGRTTVAWRLGLNHQLTARTRWGVDIGKAPETVNNLTADNRTLHGYMRHRLTDSIYIRIDATRTLREQSYTSNEAVVAIGMRF